MTPRPLLDDIVEGAAGGSTAPGAGTGRRQSVLRSPAMVATPAAPVTGMSPAELDALLKPLHETIRRHEDSVALLTARQTTLYRTYITERSTWQSEVSKAKGEASTLLGTVESLRAKVAALESGLSAISAGGGTGAAGDSTQQRQQLTEHVHMLTRKVARLEANEPILSRKYNLLLQEAEVARSAKETAEQAILDLDASYRQRILYLELWKQGASVRLHHMSEYLFRLDPLALTAGTGSTPSPDADVQHLRGRIAELDLQLSRANAEVTKAREMADIAAGQVSAITAAYQARQEDLEALREQARERAAQSDDDAIIGKLQRQLMEQKTSYHNLTKKTEAARLALQRTNVALIATETAVDEKTAEAIAVRAEARARVDACERALRNAVKSEAEVEAYKENVRSEITALKEEVQGLSAVNDRICRERDEAVAIRSSLQASLQAVEIERDSMGLDIARLQRQLLAAGTAVAAAARPATGGASGAGPGGVGSSQTKAQQQKAYDALFQECRMAETQRDEAINERDALQHNVTRLEAERSRLRDELSQLRNQLAGEDAPTVPVAVEYRGHSDARLKEVQATAQVTNASLTALLAKKNETIKMYQRRLDEMSREREAERASDAAQKERLANEVFQENQETINRLRLAMEQLDRPQDDGGLAAASAARTQLLEQVASMEALLLDRDRTVSRLEAELIGMNESLIRAQERAGDAVGAYEQARMEMETMRQALNSRDLDKLVRTLKEQLSLKEKKLRQLQDSLDALKDAFVKAEEELALHKATQAALPAAVKPDPSKVEAESKAQEEIETLRRRIASLERSLKTSETQKQELRKRVASQEASLKSLDADKSDLESRLQTAQARLERDSEKETLKKKLAVLEKSVKLLEAQKASLEGKLAAASGRREGEEGDTLARKVSVLEAQNAALRSAVEEAQHKKDLDAKVKGKSDAVQRAADRNRIFELEEEVARLREVASASGADKDRLRALQNLLDVAKRSADAANAESKELRARLKKLEAAKTQEGDEFDVAKLRASEEKFLHEAGLRERLALQRQQITELEAAVMEKEAAVTDLRFEVETERETSARLRRRLEDLPRSGADTEEKDREPKASDHAGSPVRARSAGPREGSLPSSEASKRVVELESLVQALKRVVDKQKTEMDRAHKTHDRLRQQKAELLRQLAEAQGRPGGDAMEAEMEALRRQAQELSVLRERQSETIAKQKQEIARLLRLTDKLKAQQAQPGSSGSGPGATSAAPAAPVAATAPSPATRPSTSGGSGGSSSQMSDEVVLLNRRVMEMEALREQQAGSILALETENASLRKELEAFDLEFFEDLEDLKYKYQEAALRCRAFDEHLAVCNSTR